MKSLILTIFLTNIVFANYVYENPSKGKIDMHGGKSSSLVDDKSSFSNSNFNSLGNIGIKKEEAPKEESIINKEKKRESK